ncbi:hypothetical protein [Acinetobacter terrestris]|jgi:hypothetical protein|uniref:Uncharacterized protein n=1 Tax=Acinetobacter terrestris TaxID=2529843 RepID=A0AAW6UV21_9GAMM|nr:hypothetical protein [Acinetobacter terrestris]MDK1685088.1 hypothetical protein [Acinetobacter terrestris]
MHLPLAQFFEAYQNHQHFVLLGKLEDVIEREATSVRYKKCCITAIASRSYCLTKAMS